MSHDLWPSVVEGYYGGLQSGLGGDICRRQGCRLNKMPGTLRKGPAGSARAPGTKSGEGPFGCEMDKGWVVPLPGQSP